MVQSLSMTLAQYAASTSIELIPDKVRERAKQVILDEMASAHFGRRSLAGDLVARFAAAMGGPQGLDDLEDVRELADAFRAGA